MSEATDRIDGNATAALSLLNEDVVSLHWKSSSETISDFLGKMAYDIAYAMEEQRGKRLERGQVVETVGPELMDTSWLCWPIGDDEDDTARPASPGMAFPVRVFGDQPDDGAWAIGVGSIESLQRITSTYPHNKIGVFVRDDNNVDWASDGFGGYKRKDA